MNETTRVITRAPNKTFTDLSLTKTDDNEWGKRKIIHTVKVKIDKNIDDSYFDVIGYSLVQVKKEMFEQNDGGCGNHLISAPDKNLFTKSIEFTDLSYDLAEEEDFALIQDIAFRNNFLQTGSKKYAPATIPYVNYDIIIVYSDSFL